MRSAAIIKREVVPPGPPAVLERMTRVSQPLVNGLPQVVDLDAELSLVVAVPSGTAIGWRDAEPTAEVSRSDAELQAGAGDPSAPVGGVNRQPARLLLRRGGELVASSPLVAGSVRMLPAVEGEDRGVRIELLVLSWDIRAGSMRGPGDFGSRLEFAWRRADRAAERFSPPPVNPRAVARLGPEFRMRSRFGGSENGSSPEAEA